MTDLKELDGVDDAVLARLEKLGIKDGEGLIGMIREMGEGDLAKELSVDEETVKSWYSDLSGEEEEEQGKEEETEKKEPEKEKEGAEKKAEEEKYTPKQKPVLSPEIRLALEARKEIAERRPKFLRAEYFKAQRLGMKWRKPRGKQGKMRIFAYYRPKSVSVGYGGPSIVRGLHPSGFAEKLVHNTGELDGVDPKTTAVRIAHSVGSRKRQEIVDEAGKLEIRVLNG